MEDNSEALSAEELQRQLAEFLIPHSLEDPPTPSTSSGSEAASDNTPNSPPTSSQSSKTSPKDVHKPLRHFSQQDRAKTSRQLAMLEENLEMARKILQMREELKIPADDVNRLIEEENERGRQCFRRPQQHPIDDNDDSGG
ncbi:hypothetical protein BV898_08123 [Hypsibius exemplaris]|uniref:Uncharacterized protein n=1 Tax=Hypsibius exemplaris TaxID=2072580 RepID=A0A1W0WRL8_HYPEX|nr:hypothetical protein BV898_08123 [Hypsibius exemplaris]